MKSTRLFIILVALVTISCVTGQIRKKNSISPPQTPMKPVVDVLHGVQVTDDYRWLEDGNATEVQDWVAAQEQYTYFLLKDLPQRQWLASRLDALWHYDDEEKPEKVLVGERSFFRRRFKDKEYRIIYTTKDDEAAEVEILNPNTWGDKQTLAYWYPSWDGSLMAFGKARAGDENPVLCVLDVENGTVLPDRVRGAFQRFNSWLPDNSGFYYSAKPLKGEVPEGEEYYWLSVYLHKIGTPAIADIKVLGHDSIKEYYHWVHVQENGRHAIYYRMNNAKDEVFLATLGLDGPPVPLAQGFDAEYGACVVDNKLFIYTNFDAPKGQVFVTDVTRPQREYWKTFVAETDDVLEDFVPAGGYLYLIYTHNVCTSIKVYTLDGTFVRTVTLPTIGTASVRGYWSRPEVYISFSSFTYPLTDFRYDPVEDTLTIHHAPPLQIDVSNYTAQQVWYNSKDGTPVSMFLIHRKDLELDGSNPVLMNGYGGFNISTKPEFSSFFTVWIEAGGMLAFPNLRGGGEYGQKWHEAGMLDRKQNVFDDFIAAAEWLIAEKYTRSDKIAIWGGSNGGLLVGAALVQRPDLFRVVLCSAPLLDMVRYHKFGIANLWAPEYGTAEDPEQFQYLYRYSPYHNVKDGERYPAVLITGAANDARTDPLHARKMVARLQQATSSDEPVLLLIQRDAGHLGGVTIDSFIEQYALEFAFLMDKLGMEAPRAKESRMDN
ncbi:S9 family peptidase [bacterium]|nr:S9 family peptidase [bacterium]